MAIRINVFHKMTNATHQKYKKNLKKFETYTPKLVIFNYSYHGFASKMTQKQQKISPKRQMTKHTAIPFTEPQETLSKPQQKYKKYTKFKVKTLKNEQNFK